MATWDYMAWGYMATWPHVTLFMAREVIARHKDRIIREYFPAGGSRAVLHAWVANQKGLLEFIEIEWQTKE